MAIYLVDNNNKQLLIIFPLIYLSKIFFFFNLAKILVHAHGTTCSHFKLDGHVFWQCPPITYRSGTLQRVMMADALL
jgi:hypothetical protein